MSLLKTFQLRPDLLKKDTEEERQSMRRDLAQALEVASHWPKKDLISCGIFDLEKLKLHFLETYS